MLTHHRCRPRPTHLRPLGDLTVDLCKSSGGVEASPTSLHVPLPEKGGPMHSVPRSGGAVAAARWHAPGIPYQLNACQSEPCITNAYVPLLKGASCPGASHVGEKGRARK